jgi:NAD+ kinase
VIRLDSYPESLILSDTELNPYTRVLLIYKKSNVDLYIHERKNARYQELLDADAVAVANMQEAHDLHNEVLQSVKRTLAKADIPVRTYYRARFKSEDTSGALIVTVGGDGTLLDASHKVHQGTLLGVNSAPGHSVGFLCAATRNTFAQILEDVLSGKQQPLTIPRLRGSVDGVEFPFPVLNDLLITQKNPAATSRYLVRVGERYLEQKSSGIWVCGAAGSTAAIASAGGEMQSLSDPRLQYWAREPYGWPGTDQPLTHGFMQSNEELEIISKMREGVIFLDGPHQRIAFPVGARLRMSSMGKPIRIVVTKEMLNLRPQSF